jgi:positive regulator of sigma E activity
MTPSTQKLSTAELTCDETSYCCSCSMSFSCNNGSRMEDRRKQNRNSIFTTTVVVPLSIEVTSLT